MTYQIIQDDFQQFFSTVLPIQAYAWKIAQTSSALVIYMHGRSSLCIIYKYIVLEQ